MDKKQEGGEVLGRGSRGVPRGSGARGGVARSGASEREHAATPDVPALENEIHSTIPQSSGRVVLPGLP